MHFQSSHSHIFEVLFKKKFQWCNNPFLTVFIASTHSSLASSVTTKRCLKKSVCCCARSYHNIENGPNHCKRRNYLLRRARCHARCSRIHKCSTYSYFLLKCVSIAEGHGLSFMAPSPSYTSLAFTLHPFKRFPFIDSNDQRLQQNQFVCLFSFE